MSSSCVRPLSRQLATLVFLVGIALVNVQCRREYQRQGCRMEREVVVAHSERPASALAAERLSSTLFAVVWSEGENTWAALLDGRASLVGAPTLLLRSASVNTATSGLGPGDAGVDGSSKTFWPPGSRGSFSASDLAIVPLGARKFAVAVLNGSGDLGRGAYLVLLDANGRQEAIRLGAAFEYAEKISAVRTGKEIVVAWHEGASSRSRIALANVALDPFELTGTRFLQGPHAVFGPALAERKGEGALLAYAQIERAGEKVVSAVILSELSGGLKLAGKRRVARCRYLDPAIGLARSGEGYGMVFRDDEDGDDVAEYHFVSLDENGAPVNDSRRVSQADGLRGPRLDRGPGYWFGTTIRSFQSSLLVGLNRIDDRGRKAGGEFQVYADKTDFTRVDLAVDDEFVVLVYAEDKGGSGRILAARVGCAER